MENETNGRDEILARIRSSLKANSLPSSAPSEIPPRSSFSKAERELTFFRACKALGIPVHRCRDAQEADLLLGRSLREGGHERILAWDDGELPVALTLALSEDMRILPSTLPSDPSERKEVLRGLASATVGITGAHAALADCGALLLEGGRGRPRTASLLPPLHWVLLRAEDVHDSMEDFLVAQSQPFRGGSRVWISGPSRTSDIELTLTVGVHGPVRVEVFYLDV